MNTPLFIITRARTGSTLLQRLLNSYDDIVIWGEHAGFLTAAADLYTKIGTDAALNRFVFSERRERPVRSLEDLSELKNPEHWQAWINWFGMRDVTDIFRQFVKSFFAPAFTTDCRYWGFKEVRYAGDDKVLQFLADLFPEAVFVFLVRNPLNRATSRAFGGPPRNRVGRVVNSVTRGPRLLRECWSDRDGLRRMLQWRRSGRINSHLIRYEDLIKGGTELESFLAAIGKSLGDRQRAVLTMNAGRGSNFAASQIGVNDRFRIIGWPWTFLARRILAPLNHDLDYLG